MSILTKKQFESVSAEFYEQQTRFRNIKIGDKVYTAQPQGLDIDYFKHEVLAIKADDRTLLAKDLSDSINNFPTVILRGFLTQEEFDDPDRAF